MRPELEHISSWDFSREIQPGVYVHDDYDLERPSVELKTRKVLSRSYSPSDYEVYDYPGHYLQKADGEQYADVRIDEFGSQFETAQASSNSKGIRVGSLFTLDDFPREDQNVRAPDPGGELRPGIQRLRGDAEQCRHELPVQLRRDDEQAAVPAAAVDAQAVRPGAADRGGGRPWRRGDLHRQVRPREGAVPLGPLRQEGREQLVLDPRLAPWAGKAWGAISTPRIGQEVIVDFLEGDPDQPIITGRVYNAEQMPPYDLPANKTQSGIKSRSSTGRRAGQLQRDPVRGQEGLGAALHPRREEPGHRGRERRDPLGRARPDEDDRPRRDQPHQARSHRDGRQQRDDHDPRQRTETVDKNETITIHMNRTETVDANETISIGGQSDDHGQQERDGDGGAAAHAHASASTKRSPSVRRRRSPSARRRPSPWVPCRRSTVGANQSTSVGAADRSRSARINRPRLVANAVDDCGGMSREVSLARAARVSARTTRSRSAKN